MASFNVAVPACSFWFHSCVLVNAGQCVRFEIPPGQRWIDWTIPSGPNGEKDGFVRGLWRSKLRLRDWQGQRVQFFTLVGTIGESHAHAFPVPALEDKDWTAPATGELVFFANDVPGFYWNNHGEMRLTISVP